MAYRAERPPSGKHSTTAAWLLGTLPPDASGAQWRTAAQRAVQHDALPHSRAGRRPTFESKAAFAEYMLRIYLSALGEQEPWTIRAAARHMEQHGDVRLSVGALSGLAKEHFGSWHKLTLWLFNNS